jgi:hypothetical protein
MSQESVLVSDAPTQTQAPPSASAPGQEGTAAGVATPSENTSSPPQESVSGQGPATQPPAQTPGSQAQGKWFDSLPDELKTNETLTRFNSVEDLARAVLKPSEQDTQPVLKAEDYTLPKGVSKKVAELAAKNGLTQAQLDLFINQETTAQKRQVDAQKRTLKMLGQKEMESWGEDKDVKVNLAKRALQQTDSTGELTKLLRNSGYANHPVILRYFAAQGQNLKEGGFLKSKHNSPLAKKTHAAVLFPNNPTSN